MKPHGDTTTDVSIRELKNGLSEYLRRVRRGEEIHVTLRGRRIARLLPEPTSSSETTAEAVARLDAMPWVLAPQRDGKPLGATRLSAETSSEELLRWLRD
ncbi:type II toxin-antitoxin system Phd/YefM family antitoxin [Thauera propionica]|jgi:prevent-host-death family protein|uniref:type II toxin-antitoxin system Phd/YefM family antitoxin n=1 Tax=Thauera propionica TaxID=2019431 RepID=UPI003C70327B